MRRARTETGQATVEYVGLVLLLAVVLMALSTLDIGPQVTDALASSVCEVAGLAACEPREQRVDPRRLVDRYAGVGLADFMRYRDSEGRDERLDWSTDHCSAPILGSRGFGYDFTDACMRHDFGYRNYKELGLFPGMRAGVDRVFLRDMRAHCDTRSLLVQPRCLQRALQYYAGVRAFGGRR